MQRIQTITPCLWFDHQAEQAVRFYIQTFGGSSRILSTRYYSDVGTEIHGRPAGSVMAISFELDGQQFSALNGGPHFKFTEAISLQVNCQSQAEIDHYWNTLGEEGDPQAQVCGWLKDRYGLSWQVVPVRLFEMIEDQDADKAGRVMAAMLQMKKMDLAALEHAYEGD
ncbi:3-demethylubiquinone-9 3-methyltransferase [compost metagenome]|uniref:VOC family protein n=1 Tax=Pseudomonas TaxID=286 RepID=UPI000410E261|nr:MULTISPECIES: VOC family protein [Pseudomonas]MCW2271103.1 putative 3-demethylubiquinone-9 3-methyltransferase (glyoxalase superfamily) [Pseudomonas sp. JUb96]PRA58744.1 VOC family protein [Pseudomonas sp. MYb187]